MGAWQSGANENRQSKFESEILAAISEYPDRIVVEYILAAERCVDNQDVVLCVF